MASFALALLALSSVEGALLLQEDPLDGIRKAIEKTATAPYAYRVDGRFSRSGEFAPEATLTAQIKHYQSARNGERILVKGPEGLWKTPEERLGEKVENPDKEAPDMVRTLQEAEAPHRMVEYLLTLVTKGREPVERDVEGVACRRWTLAFTKDALKSSLDRQMSKSVKAGTLRRPDEVRWSTAAGSLVVYAHKRDGHLVQALDERRVQIAYNVPDQQPEVRVYKIEYKFVFAEWGKAKLALPKEVRERLEIRD